MLRSLHRGIANPSSPARRRSWVTVFNRHRDDYQVPVALEEAGLLAFHFGEFYASPRSQRWLPGPLRRLNALSHPALARDRVRTAPASFVLQMLGIALRVPMRLVFPVSDLLLALRGAAVARRAGADLLCYGNYVPPRWAIAPGTRVVLFEYHPLAAYTFDILKADVADYPQVSESFRKEQRELARGAVQTAWQRADRVICASSMTRRSLVHAGCDPGRIVVIPYGCRPPARPVQVRPDGPCRFLFVGQGIQRKGLHHLLLAWAQLAPAEAELTVVCYHVDPGIARMAADRGVRILPHQPREALDELYHAADVFVMPSLVEGFGLSYLEALAAGCHAIGTPNTGLPDLPFGADMVSIVPAGNVAALAEAMRAAIARKRDGHLHAPAIAEATARWQWPDFRARLAREIASMG